MQTVASRLAAVARGSAAAAAAACADPAPAIGARVVCTAHTFVASSIAPRVRGDAQRLAPLRRRGGGSGRSRGNATAMGTAEATHFVLKDSAGRHRSAAAIDIVSAECIAEPRSVAALLPSALRTSSAGDAEALAPAAPRRGANPEIAGGGAPGVVQPWKFEVRARWSDALCATQDALREDRRAACTVSAVEHVMLSAPGPHLFGAFASTLALAVRGALVLTSHPPSLPCAPAQSCSCPTASLSSPAVATSATFSARASASQRGALTPRRRTLSCWRAQGASVVVLLVVLWPSPHIMATFHMIGYPKSTGSMCGFDRAGIESALYWYAKWLQGGYWQVRWIQWTQMAALTLLNGTSF